MEGRDCSKYCDGYKVCLNRFFRYRSAIDSSWMAFFGGRSEVEHSLIIKAFENLVRIIL